MQERKTKNSIKNTKYKFFLRKLSEIIIFYKVIIEINL